MDFVLFDECEEDKDMVVEYIYLVREQTKTIFSDKLKLVFVELPKFKKTEIELETNFDKWLFLLRNLNKLKDRPITVQGKIFDKIFELADIKHLTKEEMKKYEKSVLEYRDVRDSIGLAFEEGEEKGKLSVIQKCLQKNMPIEDIVFLTGFSKEQITKYMMKSNRY